MVNNRIASNMEKHTLTNATVVLVLVILEILAVMFRKIYAKENVLKSLLIVLTLTFPMDNHLNEIVTSNCL